MHAQFANRLYSSQAWKDTRKAYARSAGFLCERCMAKGLITPGTEVHHRIHLTPENVDDPAIALSFDNLELLCHECHEEEHRLRVPRWHADEEGRIDLLDETDVPTR